MIETTSVAAVAVKVTGDVAATSIAFATVLKLLPPLAALVSILWIGYQFYYSDPMKEWRKKRSEQRELDKEK